MCFVIDEHKKLLGRGTSGGSNPNSLGDGVASTNLRSAIIGALQSYMDGTREPDTNEPSLITLTPTNDEVDARRPSLLPLLRRVRGIAAGLSGMTLRWFASVGHHYDSCTIGCDRPVDVDKMTAWMRSMLPDENNQPVASSSASVAATATESKEGKASALSASSTSNAFTKVLAFNDAVSALASGTLGMIHQPHAICIVNNHMTIHWCGI